jgi:hypothetical protein
VTANPAVAQVVQVWEAKAALQREMLQGSLRDMTGYRLVGLTLLPGGVKVLHGRTDKLAVSTILYPEGLQVNVCKPHRAKHGEVAS